jgi:hypothetical protein
MMVGVSNSIVTIHCVIGDGPFVEVGTPTALATSPDLVVVGGDLGWPQWEGEDVAQRSDETLGWFPLAIYRRANLACVHVLTSRWEVNAAAVHPDGRVIAIGTGAYDGGWAFEGELLLHDLEHGTTRSVLKTRRMVKELEWRDDQTLDLVVAPSGGDVPWPDVPYESCRLQRTSWLDVEDRSIDLDLEPSVPGAAADYRPDVLQQELVELAERSGLARAPRRQAWAVAATSDGGVLVGLESAIERWDCDRDLLWRRAVAGTCTQLMSSADERVTAGVWTPWAEVAESSIAVIGLDPRSGSATYVIEPGRPGVLIARADGCILVRDTEDAWPTAPPRTAAVFSASGEPIGQIELSGYDLINHYFAIQRAPEFLVLLGDDEKPSKDKRIAEVRRGATGRWAAHDLFPLAWTDDEHVQGGAGVYLDDAAGRGLVHTGLVHSDTGLQPGNAFVARRSYPGGQLVWRVGLDNQITAIDESAGRIVAVTNLGELLVIDAVTGAIIAREEQLSIGGHAVVPLSLAFDAHGRMWIGTFDGRIVQVTLSC